MAKKSKLPKDFAKLLETRSLDQLKALFEQYDVNARGGYGDRTAVAFSECPDELTRWLVQNGANLSAADTYGDTPLHARASHWKGRYEILVELGADVNAGDKGRGTPLHSAARTFRPEVVEFLLQHGARPNSVNKEGKTPLAHALERCRGAHIADTAKLADLLLAAGADVPPDIKTRIADIGFDFEFMRSGFNPELVDETSAGLDRLYAMFGVEPVQRRVMHDGVSPIIARSETWGDQHEELWNLLVPPMGHAATVQGEVVRIAGRINDEYLRNAWGNWDGNYKRMADAALVHLGSGMPLAPALLEEARTLVADIKSKRGDPLRLCELAVGWVALNPMPVKLPKPDYDR